MSDEEILKKFNETFSDEPITEKKAPEVITPYKATTNQNVVPSSMMVPTSINNEIPPLNSNVEQTSTINPMVTNNNQEIQQKLMNVEKNEYSTSSEQSPNVNYNYVPAYESKKKKTMTIKITPELKTVIVIVIILLAAVTIIPMVYDYFTHLK